MGVKASLKAHTHSAISFNIQSLQVDVNDVVIFWHRPWKRGI
jgi:hypothetical protein